jgi:hypothetical protein
MRDRILAKRDIAGKLHVVPPWSPEEAARPRPSQLNTFRTRHNLNDSFVVMYSGNHALQHPLDTLLAAAAHMQGDDGVRFVFVGGGAGKAIVEQRIATGATNLMSLPFQPLEAIGDSLSAADLHVVSMGDEVVGIVHPCKIYGAMAIGRPILFFGPQRSHVGDILAGGEFGKVIAHGDVTAAVTAIQEFRSMGMESLAKAGQLAAQAAAQSFARSDLLAKVCDIVSGCPGKQ